MLRGLRLRPDSTPRCIARPGEANASTTSASPRTASTTTRSRPARGLVDRDDHLNAPGFVIRPDTVQEVLRILKEQAGYDHLPVVTAQDYENRYESIYHLKKFDDPTQEVSVVVPADKDDPSPVGRPDFRDRRLARTGGVRSGRHRVRRPPRSTPHPTARDVAGPSAFDGLRPGPAADR